MWSHSWNKARRRPPEFWCAELHTTSTCLDSPKICMLVAAPTNFAFFISILWPTTTHQLATSHDHNFLGTYEQSIVRIFLITLMQEDRLHQLHQWLWSGISWCQGNRVSHIASLMKIHDQTFPVPYRNQDSITTSSTDALPTSLLLLPGIIFALHCHPLKWTRKFESSNLYCHSI